mmetsp:Transcript_7669/g.11387  ORF Transcript_7669/g.11387 Transcript_7669/m.11387 type:complete len:153 (+) Transcript_7669:65-523(+)
MLKLLLFCCLIILLYARVYFYGFLTQLNSLSKRKQCTGYLSSDKGPIVFSLLHHRCISDPTHKLPGGRFKFISICRALCSKNLDEYWPCIKKENFCSTCIRYCSSASSCTKYICTLKPKFKSCPSIINAPCILRKNMHFSQPESRFKCLIQS